jgi:hypothetical protein
MILSYYAKKKVFKKIAFVNIPTYEKNFTHGHILFGTVPNP